MQGTLATVAKTAALLNILGLILAGCSAKTGQTKGDFMEKRRFVPRIHVENDSFGIGVSSGSEYWNCTYDIGHDGYWCPADR